MTSHNDGPGMGEKTKGLAKEAAGKVAGDDEMEREGEAQQQKAQKADEARRHEAEAERKRAEQRDEEDEQLRRQD